MNDPVICVHNLGFAYDTEPVLTGVNFDIFPGEFVSVIGPNGGGKSTLLKLILGLLKPTSGKIEVFGRTPQASRKQIGYVPQYVNFDAKFPVTALEVVQMGRVERHWLGWYSPSDKAASLEALDRVGLKKAAAVSFAELSGGQRQRVLIARALATEAPLLLLDEPTNNVDQASQEGLFQTLSQLGADKTILLVSHDMDVVSSLTKRVVCVNREVVLHDTETIGPETLVKLFSSHLRLVRHDHKLSGDHHHG